MFLNCVLKPVFRSNLREDFRNECTRHWCDGLKDAVCAAQRIQGHRNYLAEMPCHVRIGSVADVLPDRTRTAPRKQPGTAGPVRVALRTFEQRNPPVQGFDRLEPPGP